MMYTTCISENTAWKPTLWRSLALC